MRAMDREAFEAAWAARSVRGLKALAPRIGAKLEISGLLALDALRGDRLPLVDVADAIADATADPCAIALRAYGSDYEVHRTYLLAVCDREHARIVVGIVTTRRRGAIGAAWPELKPWFKELHRNTAVALRWARATEHDRRVAFALVARETAVDAHGGGEAAIAALVEQIVAQPEDVALRGVLADALLERDDPRGELIRLELARAAAGPGITDDDVARIAELESRLGPAIAREVADHASTYTLRGGFVDSVTMTAARFARMGEALFRAQPIRQLVLDPVDEAAVAKLASAPALRLVRALRLEGDAWRPRAIDLGVLAGVELPLLAELEIYGCRFEGGVVERLVTPSLGKLALLDTRFDGAALHGVLHGPARTVRALIVQTLDEVELPAMREQHDAAVRDCKLAALDYLELIRTTFATDARVAALVAAAPNLQEAKLGGTGEATAAALSRCTALDTLCVFGRLPAPESVAQLLTSRTLRALLLLAHAPPVADLARVAELLLALPATHPLRTVHLQSDVYRARLDQRFPA